MKIRHLDTVYLNNDTGQPGTAMEDPNRPGHFAAIFEGYWGVYAVTFNEDGLELGIPNGNVVVIKIDEARKAWASLDITLRTILKAAAETKKITAIKYLRQITAISLSDAKRAIEEFEA